jgi:hypothetical protein
VLQLTDEGPVVVDAEWVIGTNELELADVRSNLDATRTDKGYCFKPRKMACPYRDIPCYTCRNWATTPAFLPEFEATYRDLRFPIELGEKTGREHWVDKNPQKLARILPVIQTLQTGSIHGQLTKTERESRSGNYSIPIVLGRDTGELRRDSHAPRDARPAPRGYVSRCSGSAGRPAWSTTRFAPCRQDQAGARSGCPAATDRQAGPAVPIDRMRKPSAAPWPPSPQDPEHPIEDIARRPKLGLADRRAQGVGPRPLLRLDRVEDPPALRREP